MNEALSEFNRLCKESDSLYHAYAQKLGLSDAAMWLLYALCESDEPLSQYELSTGWFYSKQTVNSAVSTLMRSGHVTLRPMSGARHRKAVELTDAGRAFCQAAILPLMNAENRAMESLGADDLRLLLSLFKRQSVNLRQELTQLSQGGLFS